jgi:predicted ATPase
MITSVKLCVSHAVKVGKLGIRNPRVVFQPGYNVLIGPNGSGKSTILRAIAACNMCAVSRAENDVIRYISTETLNPNMGGTFDSWEKMIQGIRAMFLSHGQGVVDGLMNQARSNETVVLIDSPETGQDIENAGFIYRGLLKMAERCQVIVATNSLIFMRSGNRIDLGEDSLARLVKATKELASGFDAPA